jgi:hypothetical protein
VDVVVFDPGELSIALSALRSTVRRPSARQYRFLQALAMLHGTPSRGGLPPAPRLLVASVVRDAHRRKRLVQLALLMAMLDGDFEAEAPRQVLELASALDVAGPWLHAPRRRFAKTLDVARWLAPRALGRRRRARAAFSVFADYPPRSLGRALWEQRQRHDCGLAGPPRLVHAASHLLSGYEPNPSGEIQQIAFQAGNMRKHGFAHLVANLARQKDARAGRYRDAAQLVIALARGARCKTELGEDWNLWSAAERPIEELRAELEIPPLTAASMVCARAIGAKPGGHRPPSRAPNAGSAPTVAWRAAPVCMV